ncbi:MAG: hypothetical protein RMJ33_12605 [Saprospiraceae bacterium]|nr:hypothetical protein [Saprospiraceae bacterium]MDW8230668.1 hypothetical protein [Saprospiraceae bacterium]
MLKKMFPVATALLLFACSKDNPPAPVLNFVVRFDATQPRLNNIGQPATIPPGHAAQTPQFREMSIHYIELAPGALTPLGKGAIVYHAPEVTTGGEAAVDFDRAARAGNGQTMVKINLKDVPPGTYEWVRASVTYQNYDVVFNVKKLPVIGDLNNQTGHVASFVGFNTYIREARPKDRALAVNANRKQGFWVLDVPISPQLFSGQAPPGATTVVNPLFATSPIPPGSCVVTGKFDRPLVVTGDEKQDITVTLSFSVNKSFEWEDTNGNGQLDFYGDGVTPNERIVDMGLRGLIPTWK